MCYRKIPRGMAAAEEMHNEGARKKYSIGQEKIVCMINGKTLLFGLKLK